MTFDISLANYLRQVVSRCRLQLGDWYALDALPAGLHLDDLALTALHFLHTAIDRNEGKTGFRPDYLLVLPDAELPENILQGALLGALLSKYRANYITASPAKVGYGRGDILLRIQRNGDTDLRQVVQVDEQGAIVKLTSFPKPDGLREPAAHRNFIKLLAEDDARKMGFGGYTRTVVQHLAANMKAIRVLLKDVNGLVAAFPHRLGLLCGPDVLAALQAGMPLPVRDWTQSGGFHLALPLAPMVEAARNYDTLNRQVFAEGGNQPVCDELLIFDADKYCDGNGLFDRIRQGRNWQNYRNLVLVGSRPPKAAHEFWSWEWTPEELALLRGLPCRPLQVVPCNAPTVRAAHEALTQRIAGLAATQGLELKPLMRGAALFYRLVLPPANAPAQAEALRQTAGLLAWVQGQLASDEPFAEASIWDDDRAKIRAELLALFETLAQAVAHSNAKFEAVRAACAAQAAAGWPKGKARRGKLPPVVLVLPRREAGTTEAALKTALAAVLRPDQAARLQVVPVQRLPQAIAQPSLNRPGAVWLLPTLRLGRATLAQNELNLYRQLLLLRADVRLLAYQGIEENRAAQLAVRHGQLVEAALLHPGRAHFVGELLPVLPAQPPLLPAESVPPAPADAPELPPLTYTPTGTPAPDEQAGYDDLDALFGPVDGGGPVAPAPWRPVWPPSPEALAADELADGPELNLTDDDQENDEGDENQGGPNDGPVYTLRFTNMEEMALPATARVYARLPGEEKWQPRTPPQLLPADEVLVLVSNPSAIRAQLQQSQPERMREVQEMADLWKQVLRQLHQVYHNDVVALHKKLQAKGLRVREQSVANWLNGAGHTRFPEALSDLQALADLETHHMGAAARLAPQMERLKAARHVNDRAVAGYSRTFNAQVRRYLKDNRAVPTDPELASLLHNTKPRRLHSVVPGSPNQLNDPFWFFS